LISVLVLAIVGFVPNFWVAVTLLILWGLMFSAMMPVRQTYLNGLIPSEQRATVLSFDSLFNSSGGVVFQPLFGKAADVWGYPASYIFSAAIQALAVPFTWLARHEKAASDAIRPANGRKSETKLAAIASAD
jgi:MFS family permease